MPFFFPQSFNIQYRKGIQEISNKWILEWANYKMLDWENTKESLQYAYHNGGWRLK